MCAVHISQHERKFILNSLCPQWGPHAPEHHVDPSGQHPKIHHLELQD